MKHSKSIFLIDLCIMKHKENVFPLKKVFLPFQNTNKVGKEEIEGEIKYIKFEILR